MSAPPQAAAPNEDEIARYLLLNGKGWHDEDGSTVVDGIDAEGPYPVRYHWKSGGAGCDSIRGFIEQNHLPADEAIELFAKFLADRASRPPAVPVDLVEARVTQGMAVALATIHRIGHNSGDVKEAAKAAGLTVEAMKRAGVNPYDWQELEKAGVQ